MSDFVIDNPTEALDASRNPVPYVPSSASEFTGAAFMSGLMNPSTAPIARGMNEQSEESGGLPFGNMMDTTGFAPIQTEMGTPQTPIAPKDLEAHFPGVKFDAPMTMGVATDYAKAQQDQNARDAIMARYPAGVGKFALGIGAGGVSSLLDPVADAAFMVPVVGEARYAQWLARAGESAGLLGRAGVTLGVGAARAEAGQGVLSAFRSATDPDYTMGEAASDLLQAPLAGAILHGGLSFHSDILGARFAESAEGGEAAASADTHDAAVRTAAAQLANGDPVEVRPVFDAARTRSDLMNSTALSRTNFDDGARLDDAVGRSTGTLRSQDEIRLSDQAEIARSMPPDAVVESQLAEARAAVEQMRSAGALTEEDEAALKAVEPQRVAQDGDVTEPHSGSPEPTTFTTAKGSTYEVTERGTTIRNKAARDDLGHEGQSGPQPESERTYYVGPKQAEALSLIQTEHDGRMAVTEHSSGRIGVKYLDGKDAGKFERRTMVKPFAEPAPGLIPVETWKGGERVHFGNEITAVSKRDEAGAASEQPQMTTVDSVAKARDRAAMCLAAGEI